MAVQEARRYCCENNRTTVDEHEINVARPRLRVDRVENHRAERIRQINHRDERIRQTREQGGTWAQVRDFGLISLCGI